MRVVIEVDQPCKDHDQFGPHWVETVGWCRPSPSRRVLDEGDYLLIERTEDGWAEGALDVLRDQNFGFPEDILDSLVDSPWWRDIHPIIPTGDTK